MIFWGTNSNYLRTNLYNLAAYLDKICERGIQLGGEILRDLNGFIR